MARYKSKDMKKLNLQIVGISKDLREGYSKQRTSANTMRLDHSKVCKKNKGMGWEKVRE